MTKAIYAVWLTGGFCKLVIGEIPVSYVAEQSVLPFEVVESIREFLELKSHILNTSWVRYGTNDRDMFVDGTLEHIDDSGLEVVSVEEIIQDLEKRGHFEDVFVRVGNYFSPPDFDFGGYSVDSQVQGFGYKLKGLPFYS